MNKSKLVAPHLAPLVALAAVGTDFSYQSALQHVVGITKVIPLMKLKSEHVTEFKTEINKLIDLPLTGEYAKTAQKYITDARDNLIANNAAQDNGAGARHVDRAATAKQGVGATTSTDKHPQ
jgi:hypothetical protein